MVLTVAANLGSVTITDVYNGETKLTKNTHYTLATGGKVTLLKTYLDDLEEDAYTITIKTSQGNASAAITVTDTTTLTADPATADFDKNTEGEGYVDVVIEVKHNTTGVTLTSVNNGETALTGTTHYTTDGLKVTILKTYLATLEEGATTITFKTNKGDVDAIITVTDTTTLTADPATATFDKNTSGEGYDDVVIEVKHNTSGVTLTSVHNGEVTLTPITHYTADGLVVTLLKTYLATLDEGEATITFKTNKGDVDAVITVEDTTEEA